MRPTTPALQSRSVKTRIRWPKPTKPSPITVGKLAQITPWLQGNIRSNARGTSALPRTSTPARRHAPNASCSSPDACIRWAKCTTAPQRWTGWCKSRSAASRSPRRLPRRRGATLVSISSTRLVTSTSPSRSSARCACSMVWSRSSTRSPQFSRSPRPSGVRQINIRFRGSSSSTRWTASAPTFSTLSKRFASGSARARCRFKCRSVPKTSSKASSTSSR